MLLAFSVAFAAHPADPKIINGEDAAASDYPETGALVVSVMGQIALQCSSSLIAPDVVLLAAHCVDPSVVGVSEFDGVGWSRTADLRAYQSATDWSDDIVAGAHWEYHPDWNYASLQVGLALNYDIGLLFLDEALTDAPHAWLPSEAEAEAVAEGAEVTIVGWGMTDAMDTTSYGLKQWGDSTIDELADFEFQVGAATDAVRKCHGDSGGPTFLRVETDAIYDERVVGVTSHTWDETDCMETGGVDTRVDYYLDWIDETMVARCEDGTRAWCDTPGILVPPVPRSYEELMDDVTLVGCATAGGAGRTGLVAAALAAAALLRRRR